MFGTKKHSPRKARPRVSAAAPILVMPRQTANDIASRQQIRESLHDARATVVRGGRRKKR